MTVKNALLIATVFVLAAFVGWWRETSLIANVLPLPSNEPAPCAELWFEECAEASGIDFRHVATLGNKRLFPEIIGGGAGWLDHDGDGDLDLYLVQSGDVETRRADLANRLYRNDGAGAFTDVTSSAGVGDTGYGMGCAVGDYDGDGHVDLYVTNYGANVLYHNRGDGTFEDVTAASGTGSNLWSMSAAFCDFDGDGDLDLFVVNYVVWTPRSEIACKNSLGESDYCSPKNYDAPAPDQLFLNQGDGTFVDASVAAGLDRAYGNGMGLVCADFDRDGWVDVYVANDGMPNQLWINQHDGTFVDSALLLGCSVNRHGAAEAGMGVVAFDLGSDGDLDLFITHLRYETNTCYAFQDGVFDDVSASPGLAAPSHPYTGFGVGAADFDHDGNLDLLVVNGAVGLEAPYLDASDPFAQPNLLFAGRADSTFDVVPCAGLGRKVLGTSRAAAFADYDEDGDVDVVVVERDRKVRLLRNLAAASAGAWLQLRLVDAAGGEGAGALVGVRSGDKWRWRVCGRGYSYLASNDPRVHFALGAGGAAEDVVVQWPRGSGFESFGARACGAVHTLVAGQGQPAVRAGMGTR